MSGKKMEGDEDQRRKAARRARDRGREPSAEGKTQGASKQREHLRDKEDHREKVETIREGKQPVLTENTPEPRPGYGASSRDR